MRMEFLKKNIFNTSTIITVNTGTVAPLYDRRDTIFSAVLATTTASTFTASFNMSTQTVSRIVLQGINWKNFTITYNTSNSISLNDAETTTSAWSSNSATNLYLHFDSITSVYQIDITVNSNASGSLSHSASQIWISDKIHQFERNPDARDYKPSLPRKDYVHKLADGGSVQYVIQNTFETNMKINHVSESEKNNLKTLYNNYTETVFAPFPTATSWDNEIYEVLWIGAFDFITRAYNNPSAGFNGTLKLVETGK